MKIEDTWVSVHTCRYPKKEGNYLVTTRDAEGKYGTRVAYFGGDGKWNFNTYWSEEDIVAWMKMPKPFVE